ncbi:putative armadillo-like helical, pumilio domain-containing protein [Helianthus debilis subsp. tardiflorus]
MYQTPSSPDVFPARLNNLRQPSLNLPSSLDIDQTLYDSFSNLNLSETNDHHRQVSLPETLDYSYGGEGFNFINPVVHTNSRRRLEDIVRASNGVNYNQRVYSGVAHSTTRTVDPFLHQRASSSGLFDPRVDFHFDQLSYLLAKERLYHTQQQLQHLNAAISEENNNINSNININILQNHQYLRLASLHRLRGMICFLAKDQHGCRILQSKFEAPTNEEVELVLYEVAGSVAELMKDQYGNYIMQKLVCVCNDVQKGLIVRELTERSVDIILVCLSPYGTRAVQKLLENLNSRVQIITVIRALHRGAAQLANDPNGHHVLQYCLVHFDSDFNQPILDQIANNCFKVATDRSGCCVLQACVEHSRGEVRNRLLAEIMANAIPIAEDPFGNYVLQHMVGLQSRELTEVLVSQLQGNFAYLSQNKYASNVVEKCLIESEPDIATKIILELVKSPNAPSLLVDPYGNFVIQSALKVSRGIAKECLRELILRNVNSMQSNLYGKKILEKVEKKRSIYN